VGIPFVKIGLQDCHAESGAYRELLAKYKLDATAISDAVRRVISRRKK